MLKKELITIAGEEAPHVKLEVGKRILSFYYGWGSDGDLPFGGISRVPVWEGIRLLSLFGNAQNQHTGCVFSGKTPEGGISIRRLDTGYKIKTEGGVEYSEPPGALFTNADKGKTVPLVFDPPPTSYL